MVFNTSHGWLTGFLKRHAFHNVKIQGELAAKNSPDELVKIIQDCRYTPDQIFNADEMALF